MTSFFPQRAKNMQASRNDVKEIATLQNREGIDFKFINGNEN
jgi:hypothetical protein